MKGGLVLLLASVIWVNNSFGSTDWQSVILANSQQTKLYSSNTNKTYLIQVATIGSPPAQGYPVVYVLDGNVFFPVVGTLAQTLHSRPNQSKPKSMLIVGIGYADVSHFHIQARAEDYTPTSEQYPVMAGIDKFGGADKFYQFIQQELKPMIGQRWAINPKQQSLFGHSFGGLFALYTLLNYPNSFQNYLVASPSLWWNQARIMHDLPKLQSNQAVRRVIITQGELENGQKKYQFTTDSLPKHMPIHEISGRALTTYLQQRLPQSQIDYQYNFGQNHGTNAYPSLARAMLLLYQDCLADSIC